MLSVDQIEFSPSFPFQHQQHLKYLHTGHLIKCIVTYSERFWVKKGLSGMAVHWPYYKEAVNCPINLTYDATLSSGSPAIVGFIGGRFATDRFSIDVGFLQLIYTLRFKHICILQFKMPL